MIIVYQLPDSIISIVKLITGRLSVLDIAEVNPMIGDENDVKRTVENTLEIIDRACGKRRQGNYVKGYSIPKPKGRRLSDAH